MANITKINLKGIEYNLSDSEARNLIAQLQESTYSKEEVDGLVSAIDDKIDGIDLAAYETKADAANKYQPKGDYLTEHQDISGLATKQEVTDAIAGVDVSGQLTNYLTKDEAEDTYLTANSMDQALYDDATDNSTTFGSVVADVNDLKDSVANTYTKTESDGKYQAKGNYLTEHQDISGKANVGDSYTKAESDAKYLTEHQDISGKVDKVSGKGLSTNDYTAADKAKVDATPTFWVGTQAEYDAIAVKDNKTFYYITEE